MEREAFYIVNASLSDIAKLLHVISQIPAEEITCKHTPTKKGAGLYDGVYMWAKRLEVKFKTEPQTAITYAGLDFYFGDRPYKDHACVVVLTSTEGDKPTKWFIAYRYYLLYETSRDRSITSAGIKILKPEQGSPEKSMLEISFDFENLRDTALYTFMRTEEIIARSGRRVSYEEWKRELEHESVI